MKSIDKEELERLKNSFKGVDFDPELEKSFFSFWKEKSYFELLVS